MDLPLQREQMRELRQLHSAFQPPLPPRPQVGQKRPHEGLLLLILCLGLMEHGCHLLGQFRCLGGVLCAGDRKPEGRSGVHDLLHTSGIIENLVQFFCQIIQTVFAADP